VPAAPTHRRPPGRYDEPGRAQRVTALVGAVALAALVVAGGYALYDRSNEGRLSYQARGYAVSSDTAVRISFEVRLARGQRGECKLRARGRDGRDVGSAIVPVGPGTGRALATSYALTTTGRASTGEVVACQVPRRP
jgi:hypothetical protein